MGNMLYFAVLPDGRLLGFGFAPAVARPGG
jgi:hypothetical protein